MGECKELSQHHHPCTREIFDICIWILVCRNGDVAPFLFILISVHQFKLRTGLNRTVENQFFPVPFSSQFGSGKLVQVQFMVWQKVPRTGPNWTSATLHQTWQSISCGRSLFLNFLFSVTLFFFFSHKCLVWSLDISSYIHHDKKMLTSLFNHLLPLMGEVCAASCLTPAVSSWSKRPPSYI